MTDAPRKERVLLMGVSRMFRVKLNKAGGFTIQHLCPVALIANISMADPEPDIVGSKDEVMAWKSVATTPNWNEALAGMVDFQREFADEHQKRKQASKLLRA